MLQKHLTKSPELSIFPDVSNQDENSLSPQSPRSLEITRSPQSSNQGYDSAPRRSGSLEILQSANINHSQDSSFQISTSSGMSHSSEPYKGRCSITQESRSPEVKRSPMHSPPTYSSLSSEISRSAESPNKATR